MTLGRFEDFGTKKDGKRILNIFERPRMRHIMLLIDEETFAVVRESKKSRISKKNINMKQNEAEEKIEKSKDVLCFQSKDVQ